MNRGTSPLVGGVFLILLTIAIATFVSGWSSTFTEERSSSIINITRTQISCSRAEFFIENITYECINECFSGTPYKLNVIIENSGSVALHFMNTFITLDNGISYKISGNDSQISTGDIKQKNFNSILISNISTNLTVNISHPDINTISIFNNNNEEIYNVNTSGNSVNTSIVSSSPLHRIEVTDNLGRTIRKYHPYKNDGICTDTSDLDSIRIAPLNCPQLQDTFDGSNVVFVNCG